MIHFGGNNVGKRKSQLAVFLGCLVSSQRPVWTCRSPTDLLTLARGNSHKAEGGTDS